MQQKCFRHGEIAFVKISKLPKGLKETKTNVIMEGSHGNNHTFRNGKIYFKKVDDYVFGYFVAKNTSLLHPEHSPNVGDAKLPDGVYELRKQNEFLNNELRQIID